jgi:hypothetical protein
MFFPDHGHKFDISIYYFCSEGGGWTEGVDGAGMVADPEPDWIRIQSVQWILTRKRVREVTQGRYGGWVGGGGGG